MAEVIKCVDTSQFWPARTEFACGFYAAGTVKYAGQNAPTGTSQQVEQWADQQYVNEYGEDTPTDVGGVSINDEHRLIRACGSGFDYHDLTAINPTSQQASDIAHVKAALNDGYPVIATVTESSVFDLDLNANPYWWGASGTHVFVITGMENDNCYLVRDSANIKGSLQGPNQVLKGPRRYDATRMGIQWATMVKMPWLPSVSDSFDPVKDSKPVSNFDQERQDAWQHGIAMTNYNTGIAQSWRDEWQAGRYRGIPISQEYQSVNASGQKITVQEFSKARCEWYNGKPLWV